MSRERKRFQSDEDILAFLRAHSENDASPVRLMGVLKDQSLITHGRGDWSTPPFLNRFISDLHRRQRLASPEVVRGWVESLEGHVRELARAIGALGLGGADPTEDQFVRLFEDVLDTFDAVIQTVEDNCARIAVEVQEYRNLEDVTTMRARLDRLCWLYDRYLEPVIEVIDLSGPFYAVTDELAKCCERIGELGGRIAVDARHAAEEVRWVRQQVVRNAAEAGRELGSIRQIYLRESMLSRGINRALEAASEDQWGRLALDASFRISEDKDFGLFLNRQVESYLKRAFEHRREDYPKIEADGPDHLVLPTSVEELLEMLAERQSLSDLLGWMAATLDGQRADSVLKLFQAVLRIEAARVNPGDDSLCHQLGGIRVETTRWRWER
jgi:hypothetical protein